MALDTRSCARRVIFESPFVLNAARISLNRSFSSGRMKFINDYGTISITSPHWRKATYHQLLQIVLEGRTSQKQAPFCTDLDKGLVSLRVEVLENMALIEDTCLTYSESVSHLLVGAGGTTHIPVDITEELAVLVVALSKIVCSDKDLPPVLSDGKVSFAQSLANMRSFIFTRIVSCDSYFWRKAFELANPILERRRSGKDGA